MRSAILILLLSANAFAETGMGLVVDTASKTMRRINLNNGEVSYTTPAFGSNVRHGRFSPDGERLAYVNENGRVFICDLNGDELSSFDVWTGTDATLSWTFSGIWIAGDGKAELYDASSGAFVRRMIPDHANAADIRIGTISHNDASAAGRITPPGNAIAILLDDGNRVIDFGGGCSVGPSPDGQRFTHNLWEQDFEHQTMKLHDRRAEAADYMTDYLYIYNIIPYPEGTTVDDRKQFTWNSQSWSSNGDNIMLVPTGKGFPQMDFSTMPWIYDLDSETAYCLHTDPYADNVFWYIRDYYTGSLGPQPAPPAVDAGPDRSASVDTAIFLDATVTDDGFGSDATSVMWSQLSGPTPAVFVEPASVDTMVTFSEVGHYLLRLTATDGELVSADDVEIEVGIVEPEIVILSPRGGDVVVAGDIHPIEWTTEALSDVVISLSTDGGESWTPIVGSLDDSNPSWGSYQWEAPAIASDNCFVRIVGYFGESPTQSGRFEIVGADDEEDLVDPIVGSCAASLPFQSIWPALLVFLLWWRCRLAHR